jgi:hypothetical protein
MKKALAIIAAACAASYAYGQGTIAVENVGAAGIIPIFLNDGTTKVADPKYMASLWLGNTQIGADVAFKSNGRFAGGSAEVAGVALGGVAKGLTLKVWDSSQGNFGAASIKGTSAAFDSDPLGGGSTPPPKLANLKSFNLDKGSSSGPTTTVVPEPSTIALGALGAALLLFRSRR